MKTVLAIVLFLSAPLAIAETSEVVNADQLFQTPNQQVIAIDSIEGLEVQQISETEVQIDELGFRGPFKWACYAENRYRERFRGVHKKRRIAEDRAARACYRWSRRCYYAGCERIVRIPF